MAKAHGYDQEVKDYWAKRSANGAEGLALLGKAINDTAVHRSWDGLSRFFTLAKKAGQGPRVAAIIRCAFGNKLTYRASTKHETGGQFVIGWEGVFDLKGSNSYSIIKAAIREGKSWDDRELLKEINKAVGKPDPKKREVSDESKAKVVKHLAAYAEKLETDGFNVGEIIAMLQKELAAEVVTSAPVQKSVVNGVTVFEPEF